MRKPPHINQLVSCKMCPLTYCLNCQPDGCKCGCREFLMDHNDIKGEGEAYIQNETISAGGTSGIISYGTERDIPNRLEELRSTLQEQSVFSSGFGQIEIGSVTPLIHDPTTPISVNTNTENLILRTDN